MKKVFLYILLGVILSACDDDNNNSGNHEIDDRMLVGEWVWSNSDGTCYTDVEMKNSQQANYAVYNNTTGNKPAYIEDTGSWKWFSERSVLSFSFVYERPPLYEIVEIDNTHMVLHNLGYNTTETYYRIVEILKLEVGQTGSLNYQQEHHGALESSNSEIATVDTEGNIVPVQDGVAFFKIINEDAIVYAKVIVRGRPSIFQEETHLLADDIKAKYGEPGYEGLQSNGEMAMQYLNPLTGDPALYGLQYYYNKSTHQIRLIQTIYSSEEAYQKDEQYINNKFILQDVEPYNIYGEYERYWENPWLTQVKGLSGGLYWINYMNQDYE